MYSLTSANKYYLYQGFIRMNLGINGLYKLVRSEMSQLSPVSGDAFIFFGKRRDGVKILPPLQEYAYVTNVCRCVSRNMYTGFIPIRKTAGY